MSHNGVMQAMSQNNEHIYEEIKQKYRNLLLLKDFGYVEPKYCSCNETKNQTYSFGCGDILKIANFTLGEIVLDLGCGCGDDCILAAKAVGKNGKVIGIDILPEMLAKARNQAKKLGLNNLEFIESKIENIPLENQCVDLIISNCVINLSPNQEKVYLEVSRLLKNGGRIAFFDILTLKPIPNNLKTDLNLYCACLSNAMEKDILEKLLLKLGFSNIHIELMPLEITNQEQKHLKLWQNHLRAAKITAIR